MEGFLCALCLFFCLWAHFPSRLLQNVLVSTFIAHDICFCFHFKFLGVLPRPFFPDLWHRFKPLGNVATVFCLFAPRDAADPLKLEVMQSVQTFPPWTLLEKIIRSFGNKRWAKFFWFFCRDYSDCFFPPFRWKLGRSFQGNVPSPLILLIPLFFYCWQGLDYNRSNSPCFPFFFLMWRILCTLDLCSRSNSSF